MKINILALLLFYCGITNAQWQPTNGPYGGGRVNSITSHDSLIYSCTETGFYSSLKGSNIQTRITNGLPDVAFTDVAFQNPFMFVTTKGSGIWRSADNGNSWIPVNNGISDSIIKSILAIDTLLFAGSPSDGLFSSNDHGDNWLPVTGVAASNILSVEKFGNTLYVCAFNIGVFVSTDLGNSWTLSVTGLTGLNFTSMAVDSSRILVTTNGNGVFLSLDTGSTWNEIGIFSYVLCAFIHGNDLMVYPYGGSLKRSSDNGVTWISITNGLPQSSLQLSTLHYADSIFYCGTYGMGVLRSVNDGYNWTSPYTGMKGWITCVLAMGSNLFAGTSGDGLFWSPDGGFSWNRSNNGLTDPFINSLECIGNKIFAGTNNGVYVSSNFSINWDSLPAFSGQGVKMYKYGSVIYASKQIASSVMYSSDSGLTWNNLGVSTSGYCTSFSRQGNNILVGSTFNPYARYSTDNGVSWATINPPNISGTPNTCGFTTSHVFVGYRRSDLSGINWTAMTNGLPANFLPLATNIDLADNIFLGGNFGIHRSANEGVNWTDFSSGLDYLYTYDITEDSGNMYAATQNGVWVIQSPNSIDEVLSSDNLNDIHIYPNPNHGKFTIDCSGNCISGDVEIIDIVGNVIYKNRFESGDIIELNNVSKGIYFLKLFDGENLVVKKIIVQ